MSNPTQNRAPGGIPTGGQFAANDQCEATISLTSPDPANTLEVTGRALDDEIAIYQASKARISLLSAKYIAQTIVQEYPDATHLRMGFSDQTMGAMTPEAILDANGDEIDRDWDFFEDIDGTADNLVEHGEWTICRDYANAQDRRSGDNPRLDLKAAAAIDLAKVSATTGIRTVYAGGDAPDGHTERDADCDNQHEVEIL